MFSFRDADEDEREDAVEGEVLIVWMDMAEFEFLALATARTPWFGVMLTCCSAAMEDAITNATIIRRVRVVDVIDFMLIDWLIDWLIVV